MNERRHNSNLVLFTFDSLADLQLAVVRGLQRDFPSGGPGIDFSFLSQNGNALKRHRMNLIGENIVKRCLTGKLLEAYDTIYHSYMVEEFDKTVLLAPITSLKKLVLAYASSITGGYIESHILCENEQQMHIARRLFGPKQIKKVMYGYDNFDVDDYARVFIGDIETLDRFKPPHCVHLGILNYGSNLQIINDEVSIRPEYILRYGDINRFEIVIAYHDVCQPNQIHKEGE